MSRRLGVLLVAALSVRPLRPLTRRIVTRLLSRLSFLPYIAGKDAAGFTRRLLEEVARKRTRQELSTRYLSGWVAAFLAQARSAPSRRKAFRRRHGVQPPAFAIVSPGAACNLRCSHCYAATGALPRAILSYEEADALASGLEAAGTSLFLLSGGEPLLWRSRGKTLFDLVARHPRLLFIVYSNGTLLREDQADRLARLGNVIPLLSLEGNREETDAVRGPGVHDSVWLAAARLRAAGVLFGFSVTATPRNAATLASEAFYRTLVDDGGASFVWVLDLAALGRAGDAAMLDETLRDEVQGALNRESARGRLIVSFLHTPLSPTGCFGARRFDGFFYLDWEAQGRRCVYLPEPRLEARPGLDSRAGVEDLLVRCSRLEACPLIAESVPR